MRTRQWLVGLVGGMVAVALTLGGFTPARAGEEEAAVFKLGKSVVEAAHFSGVKHKLKDFSSRGETLTIEMDWRGGILDTPYTSRIKIKFKTTRGKVRIESIDYKDDAIIAYNQPNLDRLIRDFNGD